MEEFEKVLRKFIYRDNFKNGEVVFECEAWDILEADQKYKDSTGQDVTKQNNIGCTIENI